MPSQEDYLDQLLRSMNKVEPESGEDEALPEELFGELSAEEVPVEEVPAEEVLFEEAPVEEVSVGEVPVEEVPIEEVPAEEVLVEEVPAEEVLVEEVPVEEAPAEEVPGGDIDLSDLEELLQLTGDESGEDEDDSMSEEEIDRILKKNRMADPEIRYNSPKEEEDLMSLLGEVADNSDDLQDIQEMLRKSDNNEALDESVLEQPDESDALLTEEEVPAFFPEEDSAENAESGLTQKQRKALQRKNEKAEKAAQKKAAREAKKAEKLALKEAKKAQKVQKKQKQQTDAAIEDTAEGDAEGSMESSLDALIGDDLADGMETAMIDAGKKEESVQSIPVHSDEPVEVDMSDLDELLGLTKASDDADALLIEEFADRGVTESGIGDADADLPEKDSGAREKKGIFSRLLDFLTEEEEEEEPAGGTEDVPLSDENRNILNEMDREDKKGKKKKGKKPKKDKKAGKSADEAEEEEDGEGGGAKGGASKGRKKKPKKEPKPKKVKEKEPENPRNRLSLKKIMPVAAAGVSLLLVLILLINLGGDFTVKRQAKKAFYEEDYETCYQSLYGKKLNESEQVMFGKSESILRIRLWMREYELFAEEGSEVEALDVLIQAVNDYGRLYEYALQWNADGDISVIYGRMLGILNEKYGLTESQALEIAAEQDDVEYTKKVTAVANGLVYENRDAESKPPVDLPDMLPEEKQFPENNGG